MESGRVLKEEKSLELARAISAFTTINPEFVKRKSGRLVFDRQVMKEELSEEQETRIFKMIRRYQQNLHKGPVWAELVILTQKMIDERDFKATATQIAPTSNIARHTPLNRRNGKPIPTSQYSFEELREIRQINSAQELVELRETVLITSLDEDTLQPSTAGTRVSTNVFLIKPLSLSQALSNL